MRINQYLNLKSKIVWILKQKIQKKNECHCIYLNEWQAGHIESDTNFATHTCRSIINLLSLGTSRVPYDVADKSHYLGHECLRLVQIDLMLNTIERLKT